MAVDFFRMLDIRNRQAFSQTGRDGKVYRSRLKEKSLELEKDLRGVLPSNYQSSITGPNYSIALRAYAIEFAKIRIALEDLEGDTYFNTDAYRNNRAELAYQKLGSMLALNKDLPLNIFSSSEFCAFALSLVEIFFGGSTPSNIVTGIERFVGEEGVVTLSENFKDARDTNSAFDISDQFGFRVDFELTENISRNFQDIGVKLDFLLKLIKPAHTLYILRFIFTDFAEFIRNADDSVQTENIWNHGYEDYRRYCEGVSGRDRMGVNSAKAVTEDFSGMAGVLIYTTFGPISDSDTSPNVGGVADVTVTVNGTEVSVIDVAGASGVITLSFPVVPSDTVFVSYNYWKNVDFGLLLNDPGRVIFGNGREKFPVKWVLNSAVAKRPKQLFWSFGGFENKYTAGLNDPTRLVLNEPSNKISDETGRIYGRHHVLNWANYVRSPDQTEIGGFGHPLNEGTPLVEQRITGDATFEFDDGISETEYEGWSSAAWGDSAWGGELPQAVAAANPSLTWVVTKPAEHFANNLTTSSTDDGGEIGLIHVACDEGLAGLSIDEGLEDTFTFPSIPYCDEDGLFIFNQSNFNGTDLLNNIAGVEGCELTQELYDTIPADAYDMSVATDAPISALSVTGATGRFESYDTTGMFVMNESSFNSTDVLWNNELLGHWNDEGDITVVLGATTYHIPSNERELVAGPP